MLVCKPSLIFCLFVSIPTFPQQLKLKNAILLSNLFQHGFISETPLSLIAGIRSRPSRMVMALVNGGAILDFRTKDGSTAMHRAVGTNNIEAVRTMLELGASPNYRDSKNLTPLYHSVTMNTDPGITETLLHDHAHIGAQDLQGWQEIHQVINTHVHVTDSLTLMTKS